MRERLPVSERSPSPYRWVILLVTWIAFLLTFIDRLVWANVAVSVGESLGLTVAALGVFVTAFYIGYIISNALGGFFVDRVGGRLMLMLGLVLLGLFTFCFGYVRSAGAGIALQALMGLAAGVDYAACIKLLTTWFGMRDRGRAIGFFLTATSLGVVTTNLIVPVLLKSFRWGGVYQGLGAMTAAFGLAAFLVLRDGPSSAPEGSIGGPDFAALFRNRDLFLLAVAGFGALWGTWGVAFWANALLVKGHGFSAQQAGFVVALFGAGAVIAKPVVGLISDLLGGIRRVPIVICLVGFVVMLLVFGALRTESAFMITAPLLGVFAFVYSPLMAALVAEVAGRELAGSATGLTNASWQLGSAVVPLAVGAVYHAWNSFYAAFVALAVGPMLGAIAMLLVREPPRPSFSRRSRFVKLNAVRTIARSRL
jgi:sugar phosphate permease